MDRGKIVKGLEETEIMLKQAVDRGGEMAVMGAFKCYNHVSDALAMLKQQGEQIKNRDESLEKAREEIKWLRGMLKEQEAKNVVNMTLSKDCFLIASCPKCNALLTRVEHKNYCGYCGQELKWE